MLPYETRKKPSILHSFFPILTIALRPSTSVVKVPEKTKERTLRFVFIEKQTHYQELPTAINCDWAPISKERLMDFRNVKHEFRRIDILQLPNVNTTTYQLKSWSYLAQ